MFAEDFEYKLLNFIKKMNYDKPKNNKKNWLVESPKLWTILLTVQLVQIKPKKSALLSNLHWGIITFIFQFTIATIGQTHFDEIWMVCLNLIASQANQNALRD